jgi:hypothetical protein
LDIASLSTALSYYNTVTSFNTALLKDTLNNNKQSGAMLADQIMKAPSPGLETLVNPAIGNNIDIYI